MNVPHDALFQNCVNSSSPPNIGPPALQIWSLLNDISWPLLQIQNNFTELFLIIPSTKIAQMGSLRGTKGLPELQIRNDFKWHFLLNHWSKFKMISQNCSSWCTCYPRDSICREKGENNLKERYTLHVLILLIPEINNRTTALWFYENFCLGVLLIWLTVSGSLEYYH